MWLELTMISNCVTLDGNLTVKIKLKNSVACVNDYWFLVLANTNTIVGCQPIRLH